MLRDLRWSEKVQLKAARTYALIFAATPSLLWRVARNQANWASGTMWHEDSADLSYIS
jgi:hypothetical protein